VTADARVTSSLHYATIWEAIADRIPDLPALRHLDLVRSWSELDTRAARLGGGLLAHGIGRDDGVAAYLYNCPEYFELFFGAIKVRAVPSNVNYRYSSDELLALLENSEAKALFFDVSLAERVAAVADRAGAVRLLVEVGGDGPSSVPGAISYDELLQADPAPRVHRDDTDVFLSYTGGTTGLPKGVLFDIGESAANSIFIRNLFLGLDADAPGPIEFAVSHAAGDDQMRAIPASPLMHSTGFFYASLPTLTAGGTVTTLEHHSFDAHELLRTIKHTRTQVVAIVGDAFAIPIVRALDEGRPDGQPYDLGTLHVFTSAGVAWSAHIKERLLEHLPGVVLFDSCGSTEGVFYGIRTIRRGDSLSTANFDAAPGLKVLSPDREELPPGQIGMLANTTTATGYHRDPEKTARTYFSIGGARYATPGDLGRIELDGTVTLIGRGVTTINTGGEKVYPAEVEEAIKDVDGVDDCLVLGVPDERFGQRVAALVVPEPGRVLVASGITDAVRARLAGYKVPRAIRFVDQVPRLPNGKVDYPTATDLAAGDDDAQARVDA
jgi:fatty-acyl-CoA synthase